MIQVENSQILGKWLPDCESVDESIEYATVNKANLNNMLAGGWYSANDASFIDSDLE